jgi:hypothetical protein
LGEQFVVVSDLAAHCLPLAREVLGDRDKAEQSSLTAGWSPFGAKRKSK